MRMEVGIVVEAMLGAGVVEEDVVSVDVEGGDGIMALQLMHSKMEGTIEKYLFKAVVLFPTYMFNTLVKV